MAATAAKMPDQGGTYTFQSKPHEGPPGMKFRDPYMTWVISSGSLVMENILIGSFDI